MVSDASYLAGRRSSVTIANAGTVSTAFDAGSMGRFGLVMPAAFTGATISFQVSHDGTLFQALYGSDNVLVQMTVAASRNYILPEALAVWRFFKIVSASAEGAARTLHLIALGGVGGSTAGGTGIPSGAVTTVPTSGSPTDRSVTITTGGTAQQAAAALATRKYLFVQNPNASGGTAWFSTVATAVQASPSIELPPGASYENPAHFCPTGAISVIHPVTGAKLSIREA